MSLLNELRIPHMGSVENAKVMSWLVAEGASFKAGDPLFEIETDKTILSVEAESDGILARCEAKEGDDKKVGDRVGYIAAATATATDISQALRQLETGSSSAATEATPAASTATPPPNSGDAAASRHSPLVKRLAAEHGIDLATVQGSGPGGKIVGDDVLRAAGSSAAGAGQTPGIPAIAGYEAVPVDARENSARRRAISRRLSEAARTTAALTADMQIDLTALMAVRASFNAAQKAKAQPTGSVLAFVARAVCVLLKRKPEFNASFTETHTLLWKAVNLGIAVDTPDGLIVPVIADADRLDVPALSERIRRLADRVRDKQLQPSELEGGTFTLSNPGSLGPVLRAEAIINPPQVALLGLPAILHTPVALADGDGGWRVEVRPVVRPSLTFDHRALDGGQVIGFLNELRQLLEQEAATLVEAP